MSSASDPFQLLGIPPRFELDPADLERRQRELSVERRALGPLALEALNDAVRALKDPVTRAERLFQHRGWSVRATPNPSVLERVFAERERIDAWRREQNLEALRSWVSDLAIPRQREHLAQLRDLLDLAPEQLPQAAASDGQLPQAVASAGRLACDGSDVHKHALQLLEQLRYEARAIAAARAALDALEE